MQTKQGRYRWLGVGVLMAIAVPPASYGQREIKRSPAKGESLLDATFRTAQSLHLLTGDGLNANNTADVASIWTDYADYAPGDTAEIGGSGFFGGCVDGVDLLVTHIDGTLPIGDGHDPWSVTPDGGGNILSSWYVNPDDSLGEAFLLTAYCDGVLQASVTFTDALGTGTATVLPVGGSCVSFTPPQGGGPGNWEVVQGGSYTMVMNGVTECPNDGTITVFVQGSFTGNFCFNATGGGFFGYSGTFTMPNPACFTYPISYKCGANQPCDNSNTFNARSPGFPKNTVHLRASNFDGSCNKTGNDTDCGGDTGSCCKECPNFPGTYLYTCSVTTAENCVGSFTPGGNCNDGPTCGACVDQGCLTACPADVGIDCTASSNPSNTGSATCSGTCPNGNCTPTYLDVITPGNCAGNYSIARTWTCAAAGDPNCPTSSCTQIITVTDTTDPSITCPGDANIDCAASTDPSNTGSASASDDCSGASVGYSDSDSQPDPDCADHVITRTWTATDGCGNSSDCVQTITVTDTTDPSITCPGDANIDCSASTDPSNTGSASASDDCSGATVGYGDSDSQPDPDCADHVITRTWTATDGCGNSSSCVQTITVTDTTGPSITCPADVSIDCSDPNDPSITGSASASDDCSGASTPWYSDTVAPGNCAGNNVITRTWKSSDGCGNLSSCVQKITVTDTTGPTMVCPADVSIDCAASSDPSNTGSATAIDDCSPSSTPTYSDVITPGNCAGNYVITRTWSSTDGCGNSSSCVQTITVTDTHAPSITCPADVALLGCDDCATNPDAGTATATDDCSGVTITHSDLSVGTCPKVITRTYTATDGCGNSASCTQKITCVPPSVITNTEHCTFDCSACDGDDCDTTVRLLFTRDTQAPMCSALSVPNYKLNASNPGQFYYNVFNVGAPTSAYSITLPYPFVTQGAQPIHAYDGFTQQSGSGPDGSTCPSGTCLIPPLAYMCVDSTQVTLANYGANPIIGVSTYTINVDFSGCANPVNSGVTYVNIHLDYGLKGTTNYVKGAVGDVCGSDGLSADANRCDGTQTYAIPAHPTYVFSVSGGQGSSDSVCSFNVFKNNPGVAGKNANQNATPLSGYQARLFNSTGGLVKQGMTDEDGFYALDYKHTGKSMIFTVKLTSPTGVNQVKKVTLKANAFAWVEFVTVTTE